MRERLTMVALVLVMLCLPLGAAPCELSTGLALLIGLSWGLKGASPFAGPVLAVGMAWMIPSLGHGVSGVIAALGETWPLALLVALPPLLQRSTEEQQKFLERMGLAAASLASIWALIGCVQRGIPPWEQPARGPFSHHLTLGYALIPPLALALHRRAWGWAGMVALGILCSGSSGPLLSLVLVASCLLVSPGVALTGGLVVALGIMLWLSGAPELSTRMTHWTAGANLILEPGAGGGPMDAVIRFQYAESLLSSEILREKHAHDSVLQWGIKGGIGAWLAWSWLLHRMWSLGGAPTRAAVAALCVGALTQDVFGDLEVLRALCAWAMLSTTALHTRS